MEVEHRRDNDEQHVNAKWPSSGWQQRDTVQDMQIVKRQLRPHPPAPPPPRPLTALDLVAPPFGNYNSDWDTDSDAEYELVGGHWDSQCGHRIDLIIPIGRITT